MSESESLERNQLKAKLLEVEQEFEREMRARGFDPNQDENSALTAKLAKLYTEREKLRELTGNIRTKHGQEENMKEIERIADQLQRAFSGEAWHGPAVMTLLEGINSQQASSRPVPDAHSIWELVHHITAWERAGLRRLRGDRAQLTDSEDWPAVNDTSEERWEQSKSALKQGHVELHSAILLLDDSVLDNPIIEGLSSFYVTLHGIIQHNLYHAGQIAILKKALSEV